MMGITLALAVLNGEDGGRHGGVKEAIEELIRESFWMSERELSVASGWAHTNGNALLSAAMRGETNIRRGGGPISNRVN